MKPSQLYWLLIILLILPAAAFFYQRRARARRQGWEYKKEELEGFGAAEAVYQDGELLWYDVEKDGVRLQINCDPPETKANAMKAAQAITKADVERHLQRAMETVPEEDAKAFGFDKGKWVMETIIINDANSLVLELGNSADKDHCARVIVESGRYEFECVDG